MRDNFPLDVDGFLRVLNHLNVGVYITDMERRIVLWNRRAEEITGYQASQVVGSHCFDKVLNHVDKAGEPLCTYDLCPLHRAISVGRPSRHPVLIYARHASGHGVPVSVSVAPLTSETGDVIGGIEVFRDETERIADLTFAQEIQKSIMPKKLPADGVVRFDVSYHPHDLVGGDFYSVRPAGQYRYGVIVADLRGHGVSAALYTMVLKGLWDSQKTHAGHPAPFLSQLNGKLMRFGLKQSFATAFYAVVNTRTGAINYASAGHCPSLHYHAKDGSVTELRKGGVPLGIDPDEKYDAASVFLEENDLLLCYTDGIIETSNADSQPLGSAGLARFVREELAEHSELSLDRLYRRALDYCKEVIIPDDVLLLSMRRIPGKERERQPRSPGPQS